MLNCVFEKEQTVIMICVTCSATQSTVTVSYAYACTSEIGGSHVGGYKNYRKSKLLFCGTYRHVAWWVSTVMWLGA
jgi:hypothetical protein